MFTRDIKVMSEAAVGKYQVAKNKTWKYLARSVMAGFFLVIAIILSFSTAAVLFPKYPDIARVVNAVCFSIGISLIVFLGGELFTGNNLIMALGVYENRITWRNSLRVWIISYIGNFIGVFILGFIFVKSRASYDILTDYLRPIVEAKLSIPTVELFLRGVLCNFIVCIAILISFRMKSESGKILIMFWLIFTFVIAGLEHSIANMGIFSIGYFMFGGLPLGLAVKNLVFVSLGNLIGGAFLLAIPLKIMSIEE